ncbi:hypothetical protein EVAR_17466_1 [Eumeta japonica]|uniref:Uncharacterized protein n=1 Tax=Eumeta variegata TaxID=151549 RepID=A0A4C1VA68_EUMVA|nr:hypothetical protein EVAR_17466_1 [Eumeta japonica]
MRVLRELQNFDDINQNDLLMSVRPKPLTAQGDSLKPLQEYRRSAASRHPRQRRDGQPQRAAAADYRSSHESDFLGEELTAV